MHQIFLLIFIFISQIIIAQNLVKNPSFEKINTSTFNKFNPLKGSLNFSKNLKDWFSANKSTPDLYAYNKLMKDYAKERRLIANQPKNGNLYAGIIVYGDSHFTKSYREYIQVELKENLQIGETYKVAFYVSNYFIYSTGFANNIGFLFSKNKLKYDTESIIKDVKPHYNYNNIIERQNNTWQLIETTFKADENYKYLTIGNFFDNKNTKTKDLLINNYTNHILYLVDFVQVVNVKDTATFKKQVVKAKKSTNKIKKEKPIVIKKNVVEKPKVLKPTYIFFETDKYDLAKNQQQKLDSVLYILQKNQLQKILIIGFTDADGSFNYNNNLSNKRSEICKKYFLQNEIEPTRIIAKFKSENMPIASNKTKIGKQKNRRVELIIY